MLNDPQYTTSFVSSILILLARVRSVLTLDLLKPEFRIVAEVNALSPRAEVRERAKLYGHCYAASEAIYHLLGGARSGCVPCTLKVNGITHWYLRTRAGSIIDATARQFDHALDYSQGVGRGFLTREPSKRARIIMQRVAAASEVPA